MSTATTTIRHILNNGNRWEVIGTIALSSSYPSGGYSLTPRALGLFILDFIEVDEGYGNLLYSYDYTNQKLVVRYPQGGSSAGTNDGSGGVTAGGATASAVNATTPAVNSGFAREVQSGANLSSITALTFRAVGC